MSRSRVCCDLFDLRPSATVKRGAHSDHREQTKDREPEEDQNEHKLMKGKADNQAYRKDHCSFFRRPKLSPSLQRPLNIMRIYQGACSRTRRVLVEHLTHNTVTFRPYANFLRIR